MESSQISKYNIFLLIKRLRTQMIDHAVNYNDLIYLFDLINQHFNSISSVSQNFDPIPHNTVFLKDPLLPVKLHRDFRRSWVIEWLKNDLKLHSFADKLPSSIEGLNELESFVNNVQNSFYFENPMIGKKIALSINNIRDIASKTASAHRIGCIDHEWVGSWIDLIGLSQYKMDFMNNRIDGLVLDNLTYIDLDYLNISNSFHILSLKRAIQLLRNQKFHPDYYSTSIAQNPISMYPVLWTNQCVIKWLKILDLHEFTVNLDNSGLNGALMTLEPRFNSETLADIIGLPPHRVIIRRMLEWEFNCLFEQSVVKLKKATRDDPNYIPIYQLKNTVETSKTRSTADSINLDKNELVCPKNFDIPKKFNVPISLYD